MTLLEELRPGEEEGGEIRGVALGLVTNNKDPQGMGRVKVRFPWRENRQESHWARLATLMAGNDRGTVFLPEVGDEVLVAFDRDDIRHPYVLGGLWNGQDAPPETNADGKNNVRKIRSRSGHEIVFNDDDQGKQEKVEIRTKAGHLVLLDDSAGAEKIEIKDKTGSNSMVIDSAQNSIKLESALSLEIKAQTIAIEAGATLKLKAGATLMIEGALVKIN